MGEGEFQFEAAEFDGLAGAAILAAIARIAASAPTAAAARIAAAAADAIAALTTSPNAIAAAAPLPPGKRARRAHAKKPVRIPEDSDILREPAVIATTGRCHSSIYDGMNAGTFPRQVKLGKKSVGWLRSDVEAWKADRILKSGAPATPPAPTRFGRLRLPRA